MDIMMRTLWASPVGIARPGKILRGLSSSVARALIESGAASRLETHAGVRAADVVEIAESPAAAAAETRRRSPRRASAEA